VEPAPGQRQVKGSAADAVSNACFAEIFGLTAKPGYFAQVRINESLTLDFSDMSEDWGEPGFDPG
jgi:hypothetical protein